MRIPRRSARRFLGVSILAVGALSGTGCGLLDPELEDARVSGSVETQAGLPVAGATVRLVRAPCTNGGCASTVRGSAVTDASGAFDIVVQRDQEEDELWALVCQEFSIDVDADGFVPVRGDYLAWRGTFCGSGEATNLRFRLESAG